MKSNRTNRRDFITKSALAATSFAHLANIALATKTRLLWDAEKEQFTNSIEANNLLHYEYRKPWKL